MVNKKYLEAYHNYVASMRTNSYHPFLHPLVFGDLKKLLTANDVSLEPLDSFKYLEQYKPRA